eukprot:3363243-Prymnesium_polylepis.1
MRPLGRDGSPGPFPARAPGAALRRVELCFVCGCSWLWRSQSSSVGHGGRGPERLAGAHDASTCVASCGVVRILLAVIVMLLLSPGGTLPSGRPTAAARAPRVRLALGAG